MSEPNHYTQTVLFDQLSTTLDIIEKPQHVVVTISRLRCAPIFVHVLFDFLIAIAYVLPDFRQLLVGDKVVEGFVNFGPQIASDLRLVLGAQAGIVDLRALGNLINEYLVDICLITCKEKTDKW